MSGDWSLAIHQGSLGLIPVHAEFSMVEVMLERYPSHQLQIHRYCLFIRVSSEAFNVAVLDRRHSMFLLSCICYTV
jgi:hypothetical protein